jgi:Anthranilate synthase component I, N terminal region
LSFDSDLARCRTSSHRQKEARGTTAQKLDWGPRKTMSKAPTSMPSGADMKTTQVRVQPEFPAFERLLSEATTNPNIVPIFATIPGYFLTPSAAYLKISQNASRSFLLESVVGGEQIGRYSWIGANPYHVIESGPGRTVSGDPLIELEKFLARYQTLSVAGVPPFQGLNFNLPN